MAIYTGILGGSARYDNDGNVELLAFPDSLMECSIEIVGETLFSETFSFAGEKGKSQACPYKRDVTITFNSEDITWSYLQFALGTLDNVRTAALPITEPLVAVDNGGTIEITLSETPSAGAELLFTNSDGDQFTGTLTGAVVAFATDVAAGDVVIARYTYDVPANTDEIAVGSASSIAEYGVYGVLHGCPDDLIFVADRAVLTPNVNLGVGDSPANAEVSLECLRNSEGNYITLIRSDA